MQQKLSVVDAYELFILDAQSQQFTEHTLRFYVGRLSLFVNWCKDQNVTLLQTLEASHIRRYFVDMKSRGLSSAYIHSHARAIKTFLNYCVRDGLLIKSPFAAVKMPKLEKKVLPALTGAEVSAILKATKSQRDRLIVLFLLDSGVRGTELVLLNVGDVNIKTGAVTVQMGKGQKGRFTFIGAKTRKQVKLYLIARGETKDDDPLFVSEKGGERLTYYGLAQVLKRIKKASGVKGLSAHACRRTFAINCLRSGMDIFVLAKLMGHADITVLKQYLDILHDDLETAHAKHGPVDKMK